MGAARAAFAGAGKNMPGSASNRLVCITFSALSVEALANAVGQLVTPEWRDFESLPPLPKLRLICEKQGISIDWSVEPWSGLTWLSLFRNKVVHAKPESIFVEKIIPLEAFGKKAPGIPEAKLETELSEGNAKRAIHAFDALLSLITSSLRIDQKVGISYDISIGGANIHDA